MRAISSGILTQPRYPSSLRNSLRYRLAARLHLSTLALWQAGCTSWALTAPAWTLPSLFLFALHWQGIFTWFHADDFAWLRLAAATDRWSELPGALFRFEAQGTFRPWSERAFFILFHRLFGWDALPYRAWVFLTQCANLVLLSSIALRLTGSRIAAFSAPLLWAANASLAPVMSWTSAYNQALCGFFWLGAFRVLLRYTETGLARHRILHWAMFLLGLGALETMLVYPLLAVLYTGLFARRYLRETLLLFLPSLAFVAIRALLLPPRDPGIYALYFDASLPATLAIYWHWTLGRQPAITTVLTALLLGFVIYRALRGNRLSGLSRNPGHHLLPLFLILWFAIALIPVLPLRDHKDLHYPAVASSGLALLGGLALAQTQRRVIALAASCAYLAVSVPAGWAVTSWNYRASQDVRRFVLGVKQAGELHPGKVILLTGLDTYLFSLAVLDRPFEALGIPHVYLTPDSEAAIAPRREFGDLARFTASAAAILPALAEGKAVVYDASGSRLRNVTLAYRARTQSADAPPAPRHIDLSNPLNDCFLGPSWHPRTEALRWMPRSASMRIRGPRTRSETLRLTGWSPHGERTLRSLAGGIPLLEAKLAATRFQIELALPPELVGREWIDLAFEVDRTTRTRGDARELGLALEMVEVR
jgi:hypothetical protein